LEPTRRPALERSRARTAAVAARVGAKQLRARYRPTAALSGTFRSSTEIRRIHVDAFPLARERRSPPGFIRPCLLTPHNGPDPPGVAARAPARRHPRHGAEGRRVAACGAATRLAIGDACRIEQVVTTVLS
jgi:hypothetical protein